MKVYIVDNGSKYLDELVALMDGNDVSVIGYGEIDQSKIDDTSLVVLSGGHTLPVLWHHVEYQKEIDLINNHNGPIIGICLGFQLLAHVFGSHLYLLDERRKGDIAIRPTEQGLMVMQDREYTVYENHRWAAQKVGKPLITLARSRDGVEFFKHQSRPIYATQFHPEGLADIDGYSVFTAIMMELKLSAYAPDTV